jgi:hypothetical protein
MDRCSVPLPVDEGLREHRRGPLMRGDQRLEHLHYTPARQRDADRYIEAFTILLVDDPEPSNSFERHSAFSGNKRRIRGGAFHAGSGSACSSMFIDSEAVSGVAARRGNINENRWPSRSQPAAAAQITAFELNVRLRGGD